ENDNVHIVAGREPNCWTSALGRKTQKWLQKRRGWMLVQKPWFAGASAAARPALSLSPRKRMTSRHSIYVLAIGASMSFGTLGGRRPLQPHAQSESSAAGCV